VTGPVRTHADNVAAMFEAGADPRLGDDRAAAGADRADGSGVQPRLVHLHRGPAGVVRPHRTGRRRVRRPATPVGAGVPGGVVTIAALFLPGMRGVDGALAPLRAVLEATR